jgi:hypothetical protein
MQDQEEQRNRELIEVKGENESIISATQCAAATSHSLTRGQALHDDMKQIFRSISRKDS